MYQRCFDDVSTLFQCRALALYQRCATLKIQRLILFHFQRRINVNPTLKCWLGCSLKLVRHVSFKEPFCNRFGKTQACIITWHQMIRLSDDSSKITNKYMLTLAKMKTRITEHISRLVKSYWRVGKRFSQVVTYKRSGFLSTILNFNWTLLR